MLRNKYNILSNTAATHLNEKTGCKLKSALSLLLGVSAIVSTAN